MILVRVHWKKLHPHWLLLFYSCQILNPIWNTISSSRQKIFHFDFFSQKKWKCLVGSNNQQWNSTFFAFWLIIEGAKEKVLQFKMQLKSVYNKNLGFIEQKLYFWTLQRGSNKKNLLTDILLQFFSNDLFRAALYSLC